VRQDENERLNQFAQAQQNSRERMRRVNEASESAQENGFGDDVDPLSILPGRINVTA
jgi:hypothetical protein